MPTVEKTIYCCCGAFSLEYGLYLTALHSLFQGAYGIGVVITSFYKPINFNINYAVIASNACLIPSGICIFWSCLYNSWRGARFCGFLLIIVTTFNLATEIIYFITYRNFNANSLLDKDLFWSSRSDWVSKNDFPFTFWHVFSCALIIFTPLWWYYSFYLCKWSKILKIKNEFKPDEVLPSLDSIQNRVKPSEYQSSSKKMVEV